MKQKFLFLFLLAFCSFYANAQFKDSSWLLIHEISGNYKRAKNYESMVMGNPNISITSLKRNYSAFTQSRLESLRKKE